MSVPDYQSFFSQVLTLASDGKEHKTSEAIVSIADQLRLTKEDREQLLPSGRQSVLANRVHWAVTFLDKAGALRRPRRAHFVITERGQKLLAENPVRIDVKVLKQFPEFLDFQAPKGIKIEASEIAASPVSIDTEIPATTPDDALDQAVDALTANLGGLLRERLREMSPQRFEALVVDLIVAMGYGGTRGNVVQRLGKTGDEGIDGVVNEDPLGLDVVYVQAKRYAPENTIGRERIQQFAGALVGQGATKGVFVTTSSFSRGATEYAQKVPQRIILLDGSELARLMIQYNVGVRTDRTILIKRIDTDYFEAPED